MKRILLLIITLTAFCCVSQAQNISYRYGKLYRWNNAITKAEALCMMPEDFSRRYVTGRNLFISGSVFTYGGCAVGLTGGILVAASLASDNVADNILGFTLSSAVGIAGAAMVLVGIPLMVSGAVKIRNIGREHPQDFCLLTYGRARHGLGLTLHF